MKPILSRIFTRMPNGPVYPRQSVFLMRNPLILLWILGLLTTLIVADGGGVLFVIGAGVTVLMTIALSCQVMRGLIAFLNRMIETAQRH